MASKVKANKINFKGKMVSIGIDMHKQTVMGWNSLKYHLACYL